jgi:hypothetical protein
MKLFLKIIIGVIVLAFLATAGIFVYQKVKATQDPGKNKFSVEGTIKSSDVAQKKLIVSIASANKTLKDYQGQDLTFIYSDQGTIKGKSGKYIELKNLSSGAKIEMKGTIENNQYLAEYIIEK